MMFHNSNHQPVFFLAQGNIDHEVDKAMRPEWLEMIKHFTILDCSLRKHRGTQVSLGLMFQLFMKGIYQKFDAIPGTITFTAHVKKRAQKHLSEVVKLHKKPLIFSNLGLENQPLANMIQLELLDIKLSVDKDKD